MPDEDCLLPLPANRDKTAETTRDFDNAT
ncbi:hypothetical protein PANT111_90142 [Pantoea brenneri]|uniref:Transposase n=1 Tax=Pantoea brenneri TaxID=472694 RepID=A0AAX3JDF8_9GAMM|nr:hypothetical protein PANT111_90142 [Pantoea brenneri]